MQLIFEQEFDLSEIEAIAATVLAKVKSGTTLALSGELGAGKTTFVRALVRSLGEIEPVSSPTYVLQHLYHTQQGILVEHWDLYRLSLVPEDLFEPVLPDSLRLIEWCNKFDELYTKCDFVVEFDFCAQREQEKRAIKLFKV